MKKRYLHFAIMFILTILISQCPPLGQITLAGMRVLGIFIGVLYGWIFIDLIWPSIFGFVALGVSGLYTATSALASGFGNQQLIMVLITLVFAGALEEAGFSELVSNWLLKRKIIQKSPWALVAGILIIAYILGVLGATMAAIFVLWSVVIRIADLCGFSTKDPLISYMVIMIVMFSYAGQLVMPFHGAALIFEGFFTQATGISIAYIPFIVYVLALTILICLTLFLLGKFVFRLDASKFVLPEEIIAEIASRTTTKTQKVSFVILIGFMALLLLPELLPFLPGASLLSSLGLVGIGTAFLLLMNFIVIDEKPMIDLTKTFSRHVQWPLLLLLAVTFPLADAMKSPDCGIMATINQLLLPIISQMSVAAFMLASMIFLGLITQITHNVVLGAMFIPFLCPLCEQMGGSQIVLWFMLYIILQTAYVTPAGSMQAAMIHGHASVDKKWAYLWGIICLAASIIILAVVGIPLGKRLF